MSGWVQLQKEIKTEQLLASQMSMLPSSEAQRKCMGLTVKNKKIHSFEGSAEDNEEEEETDKADIDAQ